MTNDVGMTFELKMLQIVIRHCGAATENPTAQSTLDYREAVHCCTGDDVPQALKTEWCGASRALPRAIVAVHRVAAW
jgi:hypothetical protein